MVKNRNSGFNEVNPELARELGRALSPEEYAAAEAIMKRKAANQMAMAFIANMVTGRDDFVADVVVRKAYELATVILDRAEVEDKAAAKLIQS